MAKQATGKPFVKGDKRINRDGRPKGSTDLSALARRIAHEIATKKRDGDFVPVIGPDGKPMTVIETILRQWAQNPRQQADFIDRAYGKVANSQGPLDVVTWSPDEWRKEAARRHGEADDTMSTFDDETPDE